MQGPLAVGDLNGAFPGVPPDEIVTALGADKLGIFGFAHQIPTYFTNSVRTVRLTGRPSQPPSATSTATVAWTCSSASPSTAASARVDSIHYFLMGATELAQVGRPLPSTPGLDAVAIADVDGDGCSDVVGAGATGGA